LSFASLHPLRHCSSSALSPLHCHISIFTSFFFEATATTEIYTLSLHDRSSDLSRGSPTCTRCGCRRSRADRSPIRPRASPSAARDRKSTRLNSSHVSISYAVFCLKKKNKKLS